MNDKTLLDWDALIALKAVAEKGTLKGAADSLDRVPSAISYQIRKLEKQVGAKLLEKTGKRVIFTPAGRALMKEIPELMDVMQQTIHHVQQVAHGWEAQLTIGIEATVPVQPVLEIIRQFQAMETPTRINIQREVLAGAWDAVLTGRCDIVVGAPAPIPEQRQLLTKALGKTAMVDCVAPDHPAAKDTDNLDDYPIIVLEDTACQLPRRKTKKSDHRNNLSVSTLDDKLQAQLTGLGHGWLPQWLAAPYLERGELVALGEPEPTSEQYLVWRKTDRGQALKWFVEALGQIQLS